MTDFFDLDLALTIALNAGIVIVIHLLLAPLRRP